MAGGIAAGGGLAWNPTTPHSPTAVARRLGGKCCGQSDQSTRSNLARLVVCPVDYFHLDGEAYYKKWCRHSPHAGGAPQRMCMLLLILHQIARVAY